MTRADRETQVIMSVRELEKYRGKWVAFNSDGTVILASGDDLYDLERKLAAAGHDPEDVLFDQIEDDDIVLGGAEIS